MSEEQHIASTIKYHRERLGLNKAALARAAGVTDVLINYWERGDIKQIGHRRMMALAKVFDISLDELMGTNGRQDASLEDHERQQLAYIIEKVQNRYREADALYLDAQELALLAKHTSLAAVLKIKKHD